MFLGKYEHTLDEKYRLIIPTKFRKAIDNFVITCGLDNCLFLYPMDEWMKISLALKEISTTKKDNRAFTRKFFSSAIEVTLDNQGRFTLPLPLREYARLNKEVVIIGVSNRIEIWAKDLWINYEKEITKSYEEAAEQIVDVEI
ncbi:MAG: division/cell wall cluster transcriptional repressor MraZ [bacterium]|nr:division/cell wall cluster transcriptional repressor MraZ [bacterium]